MSRPPADMVARAESFVRAEAGFAQLTTLDAHGYPVSRSMTAFLADGRSSVNAQTDALGQVDTDTLAARGSPFVSYTLRATLERSSVEDAAPSIRLLAVQVSAFSYSASTPTSSPLTTQPSVTCSRFSGHRV